MLKVWRLGGFQNAKEVVRALKMEKKQTPLLVTLVEQFCTSAERKVSTGTLKNYHIKLKNLIAYELSTKISFTASSFGLVEAERFKQWFKERTGSKNINSASRNVSFFRAALVWAQRNGEIKEFELLNYSAESDPVKETVFITAEQLEKISAWEFQSEMLVKVRDLFLFQCYTGLSYSDLWSDWKLEQKNGGAVITGSRAKNKQLFFIPMSETGVLILEKYNYNMPRYSNPVYNRIIKEIASICGIKTKITTHTARKTFATLKDAEGWTRESVSKMLGHRSTRTTERYYIGETNARIEQEMNSRLKSHNV